MAIGLHVVHVVLSLDIGGAERNVINQIRQAPALEQTVSVVCIERAGTLAPVAETLGARVISLDKQPGLQLRLGKRLARVLGGLKPDVVHTHQIGCLFYVGLAGRRMRLPLVVHTEHGREDYDRLRTRWLGRMASQQANRFYCLTKDLSDFVAGHRVCPGRKIRLIENGIDLDGFRDPGDPAAVRADLRIPLGVPVIGTVGRLTEVKRQDLLLRAFARVRARFPDAHLVVVGDGPCRPGLEQLAHELEVASHVRFTGFQPSSAPYLHAMDVFALTSRSEGMPQALLEASVAGRAAISTAVGGIPDVISHRKSGLLFAFGDESALVTGLCELLADGDQARYFGLAARAHVESRFSIRRMAREYDSDFHDMLNCVPAQGSRIRHQPALVRG
jgi:glycosyltransferase involved in cell wall biosynthesis